MELKYAYSAAGIYGANPVLATYSFLQPSGLETGKSTFRIAGFGFAEGSVIHFKNRITGAALPLKTSKADTRKTAHAARKNGEQSFGNAPAKALLPVCVIHNPVYLNLVTGDNRVSEEFGNTSRPLIRGWMRSTTKVIRIFVKCK